MTRLAAMAFAAAMVAPPNYAAAGGPPAAKERPRIEEPSPRLQHKPWLLDRTPGPPSAALRQSRFNYRLELERDTRALERKLHEGRVGRDAFGSLMRGRADLERLRRGAP